MTFDASILIPGDHLIYRPTPGDPIGVFISVKTFAWASHIELYAGGDSSIAARWSGVDRYPLRTAQLARVLRPNIPFDFERGMSWFYSRAAGQKYDLTGLACFYLAVKHGSRNKMWCSELTRRWARNARFNCFAPEWDADRTAPATYLTSAAFDHVWSDGKWM